VQTGVKIRTRLTAEAVVGGVLGSLEQPEALILGRPDPHGRLRVAGRTTPLPRAPPPPRISGAIAAESAITAARWAAPCRRRAARQRRVAFVVDDLASVNPWLPRRLEIRGHTEAIAAHRLRLRRRHHRRLRRGDHPDPFPRRLFSYGVNDTDHDVQPLAVNRRNFDG
jgi:hypothetical protein